MRDDNIQKYLNDLRNGDFLAAENLSNYITTKYKSFSPISAVDLMIFTDYELCKTDINEEDLGKLNFLVEFIAQYYPEGIEAYTLANLYVSATTVIDMKRHPEYSSVIDNTNNKELIKNSDFSQLQNKVIAAKKNNNAPLSDSYLQDEIAKMRHEEKNKLIKNVSVLSDRYEDKFTLLQKIARNIDFPIVATNSIQKIGDAGFIAQKIPSFMLALIVKNSMITEEQKNKELTLYDIAIQFGQLDVANALAKKYEKLTLNNVSDNQPNEGLKHLIYCNNILAETNKLSVMGQQMILKLAKNEQQRHTLKEFFQSLKENKAGNMEGFRKNLALQLNIPDNHKEFNKAFNIIQKGDALEKLINQYKIKDISTFGMKLKEFKNKANDILSSLKSNLPVSAVGMKSEEFKNKAHSKLKPLKSNLLTRILECIRNAINRSPDYLSMKHQDKINSALNSTPTQKEMKAFIKQIRREEREQNKLAATCIR
ncbi:hypothetical protein Lgra_3177 [Legionella gratiana]|uniref:Lpg0393-like VPS9-like domain-containing protein n=1 Tax=Legionella gratiana TaxID=45066 RepID=A0A378JCP1_9GAMM|nr:hypothetical protein [Legionella gratiana]KTD06400.1 hypothetical protein Lgra_3177 [Legionella gratiana]STX45219.1 Uncharacterised protein [Legionella gratiana]